MVDKYTDNWYSMTYKADLKKMLTDLGGLLRPSIAAYKEELYLASKSVEEIKAEAARKKKERDDRIAVMKRENEEFRRLEQEPDYHEKL